MCGGADTAGGQSRSRRDLVDTFQAMAMRCFELARLLMLGSRRMPLQKRCRAAPPLLATLIQSDQGNAWASTTHYFPGGPQNRCSTDLPCRR